jgi:hypothetical protein
VNAVEKRKNLPCWESNPDRPAHNPSLYRLQKHMLMYQNQKQNIIKQKYFPLFGLLLSYQRCIRNRKSASNLSTHQILAGVTQPALLVGWN